MLLLHQSCTNDIKEANQTGEFAPKTWQNENDFPDNTQKLKDGSLLIQNLVHLSFSPVHGDLRPSTVFLGLAGLRVQLGNNGLETAWGSIFKARSDRQKFKRSRCPTHFSEANARLGLFCSIHFGLHHQKIFIEL